MSRSVEVKRRASKKNRAPTIYLMVSKYIYILIPVVVLAIALPLIFIYVIIPRENQGAQSTVNACCDDAICGKVQVSGKLMVAEYSTEAPDGYTTFTDACTAAGGVAKGTQAKLTGYDGFTQFCKCSCVDGATKDAVDLLATNTDADGNEETVRVVMADGTKAVPGIDNTASRYYMPDKSVVHTFCCNDQMQCAAGSPVCPNGLNGAHVCKE